MTRTNEQKGGWPGTGFGVRLAALREGAGLTQRQLAEKAGVGHSTVSKLEAGRHEPAWPLVIILAEALGRTPDAFLPVDGQSAPCRPRGRPRGRPRKKE